MKQYLIEEVLYSVKQIFEKNEIPLCSRKIDTQFLILLILGIAIISSSITAISFSLAEVHPRKGRRKR